MSKMISVLLLMGSLWSIDYLAFDSHYRVGAADNLLRGSGFVSNWSSHHLGARPAG